MAISFRKNIAQKVSSVDSPDIYNWSKWIKTPVITKHDVEAFKNIKLPDTSQLNIWIDFPLFSEIQFIIEKQKLFKKLKKLQIQEPKTNFVFFGISSPRLKKIDTVFSKRTDIIKPYFGFCKAKTSFSHSETEWISNIKILSPNFFINKALINFGHSETGFINSIIINKIELPEAPAETIQTEAQGITEQIIEPDIALPVFALPATYNCFDYKQNKPADIFVIHENEELPAISLQKIEEALPEVICKFSGLDEQNEVTTGLVELKETAPIVSVLRIPVDEETISITDPDFFISLPELLPVDVGRNDEVMEITGYKIPLPAVKDCISELRPEIYNIDILSSARLTETEYLRNNINEYLNLSLPRSNIFAYQLNPEVSFYNIQNSPLFAPSVIANVEITCLGRESGKSISEKQEIEEFTNAYSISDQTFYLNFLRDETVSIGLNINSQKTDLKNVTIKKFPQTEIRGKKILFTKTGTKKGDLRLLRQIKETVKSKTVTEHPNTVSLSYKPSGELRREFWIGLDEEQKQEYSDILGKELHQIEDLLESGNVFRFQSKVFFVLHQLKQICNFASEKPSSPKSDFLISQLEKIYRENRKAVIFSQYDKHGTQKLEQILRKSKIRHYTFLSTASAAEVEKNLSGFRNEKNFSVLLASSKAATHRKYFGDFSYMIHFDHWWLPTTQWSIEDRAYNLDDKNFKLDQNLNIFSYYSKTPIEKKIFDKLKSDNANIKSIFELVNSETINRMVTDEDWMNILGIEKKAKKVIRFDDEKDEEHDNIPEVKASEPDRIAQIIENLKQMSGEDLSVKLWELFTRLNFREVKSQYIPSGGYIEIKASAHVREKKIEVAGRCYNKDKTPLNEVKEYMEICRNENAGRIFIFSLEGFDFQFNPDNTEDSIMLIDIEKLSKLFNKLFLL
jgi:hypothetical protein